MSEPHVEASLPEVLWRRKWTILLVLAIALGCGYAFLQFAPRTWTSTASLYVQGDKPRMIENDFVNDSTLKGYAAMQVQVIASDTVLKGALAQPGIADLPSLQGQDDALTWMRSAVTFQGTEKNDVLTITCASPFKNDVAPIVNAVVRSYIAYQMEHERSNSQQLLVILQKEMDKLQAKRNGIGQAMVKFKEKNGTMSLSMDKGNMILDRLSTLSQSLTAAELDAIAARTEAQAAKLAAQDPEKYHEVFQAHQLQDKFNWQTQEEVQIRQSVSQMRQRLSSLLATCTDDAPAVKATRAKIADLDAQISERSRRLANTYVASTTQQVEATQDKVDKLRLAYEAQQKLAQSLNVTASQYALLENELTRVEKLTNDMDTRMKELSLLADTGGMNVTLLQAAQTPLAPTSPNKLVVAMVAPGVGLLLGAAFGIIRERRDPRLRKGSEVGALLGAPVLGVIPCGKHGRKARESARWVASEPGSQVAEALRAIRAGILMRADAMTGSIMVTSPRGGEGKSTIVSNLGIAMAQLGHRTLIVDANLRNPTQHVLFNVDQARGLATALESGAKNISQYICETDVKNLDVLPVGKFTAHPLDLLNSPALAAYMDELGRSYRYLIIDTPPVLPLADTRLLASHSDATILVLQAGLSDRSTTAQAREILYGARTHILGTIVNRAVNSAENTQLWSCHINVVANSNGRATEQIISEPTARKVS